MVNPNFFFSGNDEEFKFQSLVIVGIYRGCRSDLQMTIGAMGTHGVLLCGRKSACVRNQNVTCKGHSEALPGQPARAQGLVGEVVKEIVGIILLG